LTHTVLRHNIAIVHVSNEHVNGQFSKIATH